MLLFFLKIKFEQALKTVEFENVELQEPYIITKLESAEKTWKELSVCFFSEGLE